MTVGSCVGTGHNWLVLESCPPVDTQRPDGKTLSTFPSFIMVLLGHVLGPLAVTRLHYLL